MVQNHKVVLVLGFVIEYLGEAASPIQKQMISARVGADGDIGLSDVEEAKFIRNEGRHQPDLATDIEHAAAAMKTTFGTQAAEEKTPEVSLARKHMILAKVSSDGDIKVSDVEQASVVRNEGLYQPDAPTNSELATAASTTILGQEVLQEKTREADVLDELEDQTLLVRRQAVRESATLKNTLDLQESQDPSAQGEKVYAAAMANVDPDIADSFVQASVRGSVTYLTNAAFVVGTYRITNAGIYVLSEDIVFEPQTQHHFPPANSTVYTNQAGFWLGFFAAVSIAADNVILDLNGHSIRMSHKFSLVQRFFTIIELASKPFPAGVGPPQFGASTTTLVPATNTVVMNGTLGLSSHMGIHGVDNSFIVLRDLTIKDFETGGIQLNGASNVQIENVRVGPSLGAPGSSGDVPALAVLSQSMLLLRIMRLNGYDQEAEFVALQEAVDTFIRNETAGKTSDSFFNDPGQGFRGLPDGSALYGILFHLNRPAVNDFASCSQAQWEMLQNDPLTKIIVRHVTVAGLHLKSDEIIKVVSEAGSPVLGPAGDVVQLLRIKDCNNTYRGTPLSEAQRKVAELKVSGCDGEPASSDCLFNRFGSSNIPPSVVAWMRGTGTFNDAITGATFNCHGDAMSHFNKGVVGLRFEFVNNVTLEDINISGLENVGVRSSWHGEFCREVATRYRGSDVRGVSIGGGTRLRMDSASALPTGVTFHGHRPLRSTSGVARQFVDEGINVEDQPSA